MMMRKIIINPEPTRPVLGHAPRVRWKSMELQSDTVWAERKHTGHPI